MLFTDRRAVAPAQIDATSVHWTNLADGTSVSVASLRGKIYGMWARGSQFGRYVAKPSATRSVCFTYSRQLEGKKPIRAKEGDVLG
jgi:hypothetical protein